MVPTTADMWLGLCSCPRNAVLVATVSEITALLYPSSALVLPGAS
jgi:hypothetical protein